MKDFYDKLLLALALLALLGGIAFYVLKSGGQQTGTSLADKAPTGNAFEKEAIKPFTPESFEWLAAGPQDEAGEWTYDIFTPPKIYWDPSLNSFTAEPFIEIDKINLPPFGIHLTGIEKEKYRIQFEAYYGYVESEPTKATIQLYNNNTQEMVKGNVGTDFEAHDFAIKMFKVEKVIDEQGLISRVPHLVIFDRKENKEIRLTSEPLYLPNKIFINFKTTSPPYDSTDFTLRSNGDVYEVGGDVFKLLEFDFDNQTAKVEKASPLLDDNQVETLIASTEIITPSDSATTTTVEDAGIESFDSLFE